jgi:uncharacterized membrane protein YcaP (DUF421 family)
MEIVLRATAVYFFVYILLRVMGKRELGELSAFELVLLVMIGDLVQQAVTQEDYSVTGAILAVGTIAFWVLLSSYLSFRFKKAQAVLESFPVLVVRDGSIQREALKAERVSIDELANAARMQGIADLGTVAYAVLESDGSLSFVQKDGAQRQGSGSGQHKAAE